MDVNVLQVGLQIDGEGVDLDLDVAQVGLQQFILQFAVFQVQVLVAEVEEDEAGAALDGVALADGGGKHLYFQRRGEHGVVAGFGFADEKDRGGAGFGDGGNRADRKNRLAPLRGLRLGLAADDAAGDNDEKDEEPDGEQQGDGPSRQSPLSGLRR